MANAEDHCTGRFWEGRFKTQALLDIRAVLACVAYVDLNPIRAAIAKTPEQSDYTSIQERILSPRESWLRPFAEQDENGIPFDLKEYLQMVKTSRCTLITFPKEVMAVRVPLIRAPILFQSGYQEKIGRV